MISLQTAQQLRQYGLLWHPALHDFFAIPERGIDHLVFVISDMVVGVELLGGYPVVTFNGSAEWALDYVTLTDVIWLPSEGQLRHLIETRLFSMPQAELRLQGTSAGGYTCILAEADDTRQFHAVSASEAYAQALLYLLKRETTHTQTIASG
ncbi:MAG: hypothetical protein OHK0052_12100 [Anaerolineales bacterium]